MTSLNISLPEPLNAYVHERLAAGGYHDASEFIRELIRADQKERAGLEIQAAVLKGLNSGPTEPMTREMWDALRASAEAAAIKGGI